MVENLEVGMRLHAKYTDGEFYVAVVEAISTSKNRKKAPVKVSYLGYDETAWKSSADLRSRALPKEGVSKKNGDGKTSKIKKIWDYSSLEKGMRLQAESEGKYYAAEVVTVAQSEGRAKAPVKVHWLGYTSASDEWMSGDRLRSKALKAGENSARTSATAKQPPDVAKPPPEEMKSPQEDTKPTEDKAQPLPETANKPAPDEANVDGDGDGKTRPRTVSFKTQVTPSDDGDDGVSNDGDGKAESDGGKDEDDGGGKAFCRVNTMAAKSLSLADKVRLDFDNPDLVEPSVDYTVNNSIINAFGGLRYGEKFCNDKRAIVRTELPKELVEDDDVYTWRGPPALKGASGVSVLCQKGQKSVDDPTPNQDNYFVCHVGAITIYGAVDGHGPFGHLVSFRVVQALQHNIVNSSHFGGDWERCLQGAFLKTQEAVLDLRTEHKVNLDASGAAASVAVFDGPRVHIAHIGDARVLVGSWSKKDSRLIYASEDHKPGLPEEKARLEAAGMEVREDEASGCRIYLPGERFPGLTMSRAFGDTASKGVVQEPEYKMLEVGEETEIFAILASDGIWEFMEPQNIIEHTTKKLRLRGPAGTAAYLLDMARKLWKHHSGDYCDDITVVVVMRNMPRKDLDGDHRFAVRPYRDA